MDTILQHVKSGVFNGTIPLENLDKFRLAMISALQLAERLPDEMASEASRYRTDWKYALSLPEQHPGISAQELCKFRQEILSSASSLLEFSVILDYFYQFGLTGLLDFKDQHPATALYTICQISNINLLTTAIKECLCFLSSLDTAWMLDHIVPYWFDRYSTQKYPVVYTGQTEIGEEINRLGRDGSTLLNSVRASGREEWINSPEIRRLESLITDQLILQDETYKLKASGCSACAYYPAMKGGR